jgi:type VII secretion integral membrane protein EccD
MFAIRRRSADTCGLVRRNGSARGRTMTEFTRLTVIGSARKADLVVPNDEAVAGLVPRLMGLLDEPTGTVVRPLTLVRSTGEQLDVALTIADQQVSDGELLRLVRSDDAPPPPEVADVTDVLGETLRDRSGLWSTFARELTGAIAIGVLGCALAGQLPAGPLPLVLAVLLLSLGAAIAGRMSTRWICVALTAAALGVAAAAVWTFSSTLGLSLPLRLSAAILGFAALGWICLGLGYGQGLRSRQAWFGSLVGIPVSMLPLIMVLLGARSEAAAAVTAAVSVVVCGVLPRLALVASGLTGLDDQVVEGNPRRRDDVSLTVNDAYRLLSWVTFAVAIPIAVTSAVLLASGDLWAVWVGLVVIIVSALRTRAFPLAVQQMAIWSAVLAGLLGGLMGQPRLGEPLVAGIVAGIAALVMIMVLARPAAHQRAFLRRVGNVVEALAVIALIPLLLGMFDIFGDLLRAF